MDELKFQLNQTVVIKVSGEDGQIVGRAQYMNASPSYLVRYKSGDGRAVESWWSEDALHAA